MTSIQDLLVLKRLTVHKTRIEPKRVRAAYTVTRPDGSEESRELIYSYDQAYFSAENAQDVNLASMMLAQVALNYGLFCEELVFDGLYDKADQRFLLDMLENTTREIYVHKFLSENEFLKAPFDQMEAQQRKRYTAAEVRFINTQFKHLKLSKATKEPDYDKYAILSSGGKDSLLTYGLIREIGEAYPVFINESGRHWFTAVNAYQQFRASEPNTTKPWCNSDRIFNWMVRQLPFIKENFQDIRADIYPVRLWTVAVFLFGVLPVVRKNGIGNILIGNEYDCTRQGNFQGITHYFGLYDQSKYFDNALSRYFKQKGWYIHQFSVLRSLSELLILKVLVKRYPELQKQQVSCHAAHVREGRMYPCGKCEKCRRIIGMLKALDEDPQRCGYTEEQIEKGLAALAKKSVKQIGSDAAHLYHLLLEKKLIPHNDHTQKLAREYPWIMQLRFDRERSNFRDLPPYIRQKLLDLILPYSDGAVQMDRGKAKPIEEWETLIKQEYFLYE